MNVRRFENFTLGRALAVFVAALFAAAVALAGPQGRSIFVLTSTNNPAGNAVEVFKLDTSGTPSLTLFNTLNTGGNGGASTNAGILQFQEDFGAVANFGSNTVTQLLRFDHFVALGSTIPLARDCVKPDSVALSGHHLFVVGANCAESHSWPNGRLDGSVVSLSDSSAAQIAVGETWAAVTLASGSVLQLPLTEPDGPLAGSSTGISLPADANNTPLGEAFWGNLLGFTPAHSPDSFALINEDRDVSPILGPQPSYPTNAPCWVAKGPLSVWYTGNSPGKAISIFFTAGQSGVFYKSVPLPGSPTDLIVSADHRWLAVIYSASGQAFVSVYSIDAFGDLTWVATSPSIGVSSFNGVAISH